METRTLDRFALFVALDGLALGEQYVEPDETVVAEIVEPRPDSCPVRGRRLLGVARIDADGVRLLAALRGERRAGRFDGLARRLRADGLAAVDFEDSAQVAEQGDR